MKAHHVKLLAMFVAAWLVPALSAAQQRELTGTVTDQARQPIPFVVVTVVGPGNQAQSRADGRFTITLPAGNVELRFESFGYKTQTVSVSAGTSTLQVVMDDDVLNLEGIVVTGQATSVARRNLANAVSTVTSAQIENAPSAESIEKFLQGKIAGAYIEQNSGAPGGGVQVRLRGVSTINGDLEPLYVVDGVVMSNTTISNGLNQISLSGGGSNGSNQDDPVNRIADLNPNDIERVEVLKGASAAAMYGSRAANGVVIITTKRGRAGERRITLTQRVGTFALSNKFNFRNWTRDEAIEAGFVSEDNAGDFFGSNGQPLSDIDFEDALADQHQASWETAASVSGGTEDTRYFVSASWKDDKGIIKNTGFSRQAIRVNLDQQFGDRVQAGVTTSLIRTKAQRGLTNNDNAGVSYYMVFPFTPSFIDLRQQADGTFPVNPYERSNPFQTAALFENEEGVWRLMAAGNVQIDVFRGARSNFKILGTAGVDYFTQKNTLFSPPELQFEPNDGLPGTSTLANADDRNVTVTGNGVYSFNGSNYQSTTTAGVQYEDREQDIARTVATGLTAGQRNINAGVQTAVNENRSRIRDLGFFAQEELLLLGDRLLVTAGLRADKSSVNGDPNKYFWYPKAAASYRFDNLSDAISGLKVRVAWGQSGNQPLYGQKFTPLTATGNIGGLSGLVVQGTSGDPNLTPERQSEIEGGFDLTVWGGRGQFEFTGFQKHIDDLILQRTPAPSSGFGVQVFNGGKARVRGFEAAVSATPILGTDFQWVSRLTYYGDRSKVLSLPVPAFEVGGFGTGLGAFRIEEGQSLTQIVSTVGQDANGDAMVENVGDANPDFRIGFSNDFTWKSFRLGSLLDWSHGNSIINLTRLLADAGQNSADYRTNVSSRTLADADKTQMDLGDGEYRLLNWAVGSDTRGYIEDGSYVKLREVSLAYQIDQDKVQSMLGGSVKSMQITLSGRNLLTFTDYTGLDPEVSNFGNQAIARNIDVAPFPPSRSFWLAINLGF